MVTVYILTNKPFGTLYIGQTNNLARRMYEYQNEVFDGFTKRYGLNKLVYYESYENPTEGFARERTLKKWKRDWKLQLIEKFNRDWKDLSNELI